jgi:hypothetical protein
VKVNSIYTFKGNTEDKDKLIVLYEFDNSTDCENKMKEIDQRKNRHTCFMSDGLYYVGEYLTEDIAKHIINTNHINHGITSGAIKDYLLIYSEMQAYGDMRYYWNDKTKQIYSDFMNIGD